MRSSLKDWGEAPMEKIVLIKVHGIDRENAIKDQIWKTYKNSIKSDDQRMVRE